MTQVVYPSEISIPSSYVGSTRGGEVQLKVSYRVTQHVSSSANPPSKVALKAWHSAPEAGKHLSTASSSHSESKHGQSDATQLVMLVTIDGGSSGVQDALKTST